MESGGPESASPMTHRVQSLSSADTRGKHRIHAELKRLEQEARFLEIRLMSSVSLEDQTGVTEFRRGVVRLGIRMQETQLAQDSILGSRAYRLNSLVFDENVWEEELEQLEKTEKASTTCKVMPSNVETKPDPLLPSTVGPLSPAWDRWFEGPQDSKSCCRCWIL
ncbi:Guanine nucleotide-binding protein subunit gamma 1 [Glycine soja]|uniref:Guanine nucleotide-binding protein subunit gamma 1 n=1 Tax=Glycine soja TaxID=3848 RepID=A0A445IP11_GLYSO|nr:Guanine nucleotide-binding protein subunit gamma 1 [Glycine soja]